MSCTRLLTSILAILVCAAPALAAPDDIKPECVPLELKFEQAASVIEAVQKQDEFPTLDDLKDKKPFRVPPEAIVDENSEAVRLVRGAFDSTQKLLFGDKKVFRLSLCENCDLQPRLVDELIIWVDIRFIERLIQNFDKNLVNLDLAHAFSHYVLELYLIAVDQKSPAGNVSKFVDANWFLPQAEQRKLTIDEKIVGAARYHAEVDALAAAILIKLGKEVPDYTPVVDLYRINRFKNNPKRPFTPYEIYVDQEVRVNTLKYIIENWPKARLSGS